MAFKRFYFPALAMLAALLAVCLFLPGLDGGFIFDDHPNIQENGAVHLTDLTADSLLVAAYSFQPGNGSRALSMLSFALDHWRAGGLDPKAFKATNLLIHALTAFALAFFFRQLLSLAQWPARRASWAALAMATLWAIHPLQVSSVLYVVQRMQTLGTLFLVLALCAYLCARRAQMEDRRSRMPVVLTGLFSVLALAAKEDALLLPAYLLALELTVLRFRAARPMLALWLQRGFLYAALAGVALFFILVLPHYWHWGDYPGRTFSSMDRLLTQGRVLVMYIGQILLPLPERLPFFYDDLQISRGVFQPVTTLPALLLLAGLLVLAWRWRTTRPVFACGVLLFFSGHVITSNVINLEMAFEHRNHFPLIGAVLAIGDLCVAAMARWRIPLRTVVAVGSLVILATGSATLARSHAWGEPLRFAQHGVEIAPDSERAWLALGGTYADLSRLRPDSPYLQKAIETCEEGAARIPSALMLSNVVNYKTIQGSVTAADWQLFHDRLAQTSMTAQNRQVVWTMIRNARRGIPMDERKVLDTISMVAGLGNFSANEYLQVGAYAFSNTDYPDEALPYLALAAETAAPDDPQMADTLMQLEAAGRHDWVRELRAIRDGRE